MGHSIHSKDESSPFRWAKLLPRIANSATFPPTVIDLVSYEGPWLSSLSFYLFILLSFYLFAPPPFECVNTTFLSVWSLKLSLFVNTHPPDQDVQFWPFIHQGRSSDSLTFIQFILCGPWAISLPPPLDCGIISHFSPLIHSKDDSLSLSLSLLSLSLSLGGEVRD